MLSCAHGNLGMTAAFAALTLAGPAHAVELSQVLGVWGNAEGSYDCKAEFGTEIAPVKVEADGAGFSVAAYAWGCTVAVPNKSGNMIGGNASCGSEGDGEITSGHIELGLTATGQLLLTRDGVVDTLDRCVNRQ